jgi:2-phospho-L-lactate guanylyltransferase
MSAAARCVALLPVKQLPRAKSRLARDLPRDAVSDITLAMLRDLVECLGSVHRIERVVVVTPDLEIAETAKREGAEGLVLQDPGLNPSLDAAAVRMLADGSKELLVVLGDVAGAVPSDVDQMFEALDALGGRGVVLAPANDGGTSALLRAPGDLIGNRFGAGSAAAHRELARAASVPYRELALPSLAVDLDQLRDIPDLMRTAGGRRTHALLRELGLGTADGDGAPDDER